MAAVLFGVVWSITVKECEPGGNLFGIVVLFICAVIAGRLMGLIRLPKLPPFPPLLGRFNISKQFWNIYFPPDKVIKGHNSQVSIKFTVFAFYVRINENSAHLCVFPPTA